MNTINIIQNESISIKVIYKNHNGEVIPYNDNLNITAILKKNGIKQDTTIYIMADIVIIPADATVNLLGEYELTVFVNDGIFGSASRLKVIITN